MRAVYRNSMCCPELLRSFSLPISLSLLHIPYSFFLSGLPDMAQSRRALLLSCRQCISLCCCGGVSLQCYKERIFLDDDHNICVY